MSETTPTEVEIIGEVKFTAAEDKRQRPYILIWVTVGNVSSFRTSPDPDRAKEIARTVVSELTDVAADRRLYRLKSSTDTQEIWEVGALPEAA